jgi:hypothetical protein
MRCTSRGGTGGRGPRGSIAVGRGALNTTLMGHAGVQAERGFACSARDGYAKESSGGPWRRGS